MMLRTVVPMLLVLLTACVGGPIGVEEFDWQGHRGARGEMPENSILAFEYALEQGVKTLEMDVVITADGKVVVSHEPFMSHETCLDPTGNVITEKEEESYNIFHMNYSEVLLFDCGSTAHPRFPGQEKISLSKPLLSQVIEAAEEYAAIHGREAPLYNIEIKSRPEWEGEFHPHFKVYTEQVLDVVGAGEIAERTVIQSFDKRVLQYIHENHPDMPLALLVGNSIPAEVHLDSLGFVPEIYSCHYRLVDPLLVRFCKEKDMKLIPWTVNKVGEMRRLIGLGVDGIITDYPSRIKQVR